MSWSVDFVLSVHGRCLRLRGRDWRCTSHGAVCAAQPWRVPASCGLGCSPARTPEPTLRQEERESLANIAIVIVDESTSQALEKRPEQAAAIRESLTGRLGGIKNLEIKWVTAAKPQDGASQGTHLFEALNGGAHEYADRPYRRRVHDHGRRGARCAEAGLAARFRCAHPHAADGCTGEFDRRIETLKAPRYGLVGQSRDIEVAVRESGKAPGGKQPVTLKIRREGRPDEVRRAEIDKPVTVEMPIPHAGTNIVEIELDTAPGELTPANNRVVVVAEGVRENLRVLLVSGEAACGRAHVAQSLEVGCVRRSRALHHSASAPRSRTARPSINCRSSRFRRRNSSRTRSAISTHHLRPL